MSNDSDYRIGHVVLSRAGRDAKRLFVVIACEGPDYVLISDGDTRKLARPKKKKVKHIKSTGLTVDAELITLIESNHALDANIRKALYCFAEGAGANAD